MAVQQHVLNWLYSVLTSEYHDVNRTYNDVAQALSQYPSLSPRTDVHTFPNGTSALLLHLSGTIPVLFRGTTYRFPISLWIPHGYPRHAPMVYVTPTETMVVRPGQHVDPQGQVYHPYLAGWGEFWDKSSLLDFLAILRDVFAKEPPVVARGQAPQQRPPPVQPPPTPAAATPPPVPPIPPQELSARPPSSVQQSRQPLPPDGRPPPPPPKPSQQQPQPPPRADSAPPLPLPLQGHARSASQYVSSTVQSSPPTQHHQNNQDHRMSRYDSAPPLPPQAQPVQQPQQPQPPAFSQAGPRLVAGPPGQPSYQGQPQSSYHPGQPPQMPPADHRRVSSFPLGQQQPQTYPGPPQTLPQQQQPWPAQQHQLPPPQPRQKPPPPPDLMDEPLTLEIPSPSSVPPPPIPPNPEKDAILQHLAQTLYQMRARAREQNDSSLAGLQAQRTAMLNALSTMQSEIGALTQLSALLSSNTAILHDTMRRADDVVASSATHPAPDIDALLVAPTVVGNQLYDLVAEERALADAVFAVGRAVEHGRVSPAVFAKTTRSLAREWYLKKALVRKIGRGMGLSVAG